MAVANPQQANLAPSFDMIQQALQERAKLNLATPPSTAGVAAGAIGKGVGAYVGKQISTEEDKKLLTFKASLEDQLDKNRTKYAAAAAGKAPYTQDDLDSYYESHGLDKKYVPAFPDGIDTLYMSPDDIQTHTAQAQRMTNVESLASQVEKTDPVKAQVIRTVGNTDKGDPYLATIGGLSKPHFVKLADGLTHVVDNTGKDITPPLENLNTNSDASVDDYKKLNPTDKKKADKIVDDLVVKNPEVKKIASNIDVLKDLQNMIDTGKDNPTALTNIRTKLGVDVGGVSPGRMSSAVFQNEGYSKALSDRIEQWMTTGMEGTFSAKNLQGIQDQVKNDAAHFQQRYGELTNGAVGALTTQTGLTPEAAQRLLGSYTSAYKAPKPTKTAAVQEKVAVKGPNGETGKAFKNQKLPEGWHFIVP